MSGGFRRRDDPVGEQRKALYRRARRTVGNRLRLRQRLRLDPPNRCPAVSSVSGLGMPCSGVLYPHGVFVYVDEIPNPAGAGYLVLPLRKLLAIHRFGCEGSLQRLVPPGPVAALGAHADGSGTGATSPSSARRYPISSGSACTCAVLRHSLMT